MFDSLIFAISTWQPFLQKNNFSYFKSHPVVARYKIENELDIPLFIRFYSKMKSMPAEELLAPHTKKVIANIERIPITKIRFFNSKKKKYTFYKLDSNYIKLYLTEEGNVAVNFIKSSPDFFYTYSQETNILPLPKIKSKSKGNS